MLFPSAQALGSGAISVERDGQNGDEPFDHLLPEGGDIEQSQSVVQHTDEEAPEHGSRYGAATARQRCAANDDRGDRIELVAETGVRLCRVESRGDDESCKTGKP